MTENFEYKSFNAVLGDKKFRRQHLHAPSHRRRQSTPCLTSCKHLFACVLYSWKGSHGQ